MEIFKEAQKNFDYMVRIRRHMHEYPAVSYTHLDVYKRQSRHPAVWKNGKKVVEKDGKHEQCTENGGTVF